MRELSSKERVRLIHQGNALFNQKKYLLAEKVFLTVSYQDGINRVAQHFFSQESYLRAAELFRRAKNLRGEYNCYLRLGLIADIEDFHNKVTKKKMDDGTLHREI